MKATGKIQIEEIEQGLILDNPTLEVKSVYIEVVFTDDKGKQHSRMQLLDVDVSDKLIKDSMKNHKLLKQFK